MSTKLETFERVWTRPRRPRHLRRGAVPRADPRIRQQRPDRRLGSLDRRAADRDERAHHPSPASADGPGQSSPSKHSSRNASRIRIRIRIRRSATAPPSCTPAHAWAGSPTSPAAPPSPCRRFDLFHRVRTASHQPSPHRRRSPRWPPPMSAASSVPPVPWPLPCRNVLDIIPGIDQATAVRGASWRSGPPCGGCAAGGSGSSAWAGGGCRSGGRSRATQGPVPRGRPGGRRLRDRRGLRRWRGRGRRASAHLAAPLRHAQVATG